MLVKQERWTHRNHLDGNNGLKDEHKEMYTDFFLPDSYSRREASSLKPCITTDLIQCLEKNPRINKK